MRVFGMSLCLALSLAGVGVQALAQSERPKVATGLWEIEMTSKMSGAALPPQMANMPARTTKIHSCATQENIEDTFTNANPQQRQACMKSNMKTTATGISVDISCNNGATTGHVDVIFDSDSSAHTTIHITTQINGMAIQMDGTSVAKRLGADCGSVSPGKAQIVQ